MIDLNELCSRVSWAIHEAERAWDGGQRERAQELYSGVSRIEEGIAEIVPACDVEGALARRGAVAAALLAGQRSRAFDLVEKYIAEPHVSEELRGQLRAIYVEGCGQQLWL
jgi:hypothetical protein